MFTRSLIALASLGFLTPLMSAPSCLIIAHRGASGYLPEHSLEAKALAFGMGADYLEQDVVLTHDGIPIVLHDIHLDEVTDVAQQFPQRHREDGRFYAIDFDWAEIAQLQQRERFDHQTGQSVFPDRYPAKGPSLSLHTLEEEIRFIQALNHSTGREVGIYLEIKQPAFHRAEGQDITRIVHEMLSRLGYNSSDDKAFIQCFEPSALIRLGNEFHSPLKRIQLIGLPEWEDPTDYRPMLTTEGLAFIAQYAEGIGPHAFLLAAMGQEGPESTGLTEAAHDLGLKVHPYTFRKESLPEGVGFEALTLWFAAQLKVDGMFTDFTDETLHILQQAGLH